MQQQLSFMYNIAKDKEHAKIRQAGDYHKFSNVPGEVKLQIGTAASGA